MKGAILTSIVPLLLFVLFRAALLTPPVEMTFWQSVITLVAFEVMLFMHVCLRSLAKNLTTQLFY